MPQAQTHGCGCRYQVYERMSLLHRFACKCGAAHCHVKGHSRHRVETGLCIHFTFQTVTAAIRKRVFMCLPFIEWKRPSTHVNTYLVITRLLCHDRLEARFRPSNPGLTATEILTSPFLSPHPVTQVKNS